MTSRDVIQLLRHSGVSKVHMQDALTVHQTRLIGEFGYKVPPDLYSSMVARCVAQVMAQSPVAMSPLHLELDYNTAQDVCDWIEGY